MKYSRLDHYGDNYQNVVKNALVSKAIIGKKGESGIIRTGIVIHFRKKQQRT